MTATTTTTSGRQARGSLLDRALALNGVLSLGSGALMTVAPGTVGSALGVNGSGWIRLVGAGLLGHAALLAYAMTRDDRRPWGRLNLAAIAPYPLAMIALAVLVVSDGAGRLLVLGDGALIAGIAAMHWAGLRRSRPPTIDRPDS